jgi:3-oxoacyl-[acyl-carrier protein] reductase
VIFMKLSGKVAIVTGASRGIGESIAVALAEQGCRVMLAARDEVALKSVCARISADGGQAVWHCCDVGVEAEVAALVEATVEQFGRMDIVVNNAGLGSYGLLEKSSTDEWDAMMKINARGPYLLCRYSIPHLRQRELSFVVNVGSVVSVKGYAEQSIYAASKHALLGMTKSLAREVQPDNIRVHAICPGGVDTEMVSRSRPDLDRSVLMQPEDIADIVVFLVTRRGNAVIDQIQVRRAASTPWG